MIDRTRVDWIVGIDPGVHGAIALWAPEKQLLEVIDMPVLSHSVGKRAQTRVDATTLAHFLCGRSIALAVLEKVANMPGQGGTSIFSFGRSVGVVEGILAANLAPLHLVAPAVWKKFHQIAAGAGKDDSRAAASRRLPQYADQWPLKKHDGRAEAVLMALWGEAVIKAISK